MITNWLTSITGQLFGYLMHTMWWILMLFKHLYMPFIIWMWPSKEAIELCSLACALEIQSHCCVCVLFVICIHCFIHWIFRAEWRCDTGLNSFVLFCMCVRPMKHTQTQRVRKRKRKHNASERKGVQKKVFCNLCKNKSHKMIWGVFGSVHSFRSRPLLLISFLCALTHLLFIHPFIHSFFFKYSFVCCWCNFCMAHCCLPACTQCTNTRSQFSHLVLEWLSPGS